MTAETITTSPLSASLPGRPGDHKKLDKQFHVDTVVTTSLTVGRRLALEPIRDLPNCSAANKMGFSSSPDSTFQVFTTLHGNILLESSKA